MSSKDGALRVGVVGCGAFGRNHARVYRELHQDAAQNVEFVGVESPELSKQIQIATGGMPISLGLDAVGGPATATMASVLSPGAYLVSYAVLSGLPIHVMQGDLIGKRLNIHGFWMYYEEYLPKMRATLTEATKVVASGKLSLPITKTYKPSQIKEAIEHYERGGKVLLDFNYTK